MSLNRKVCNKFDVDIYTKFIHKHSLFTHKHTFPKYCQMSLKIFLSNKAQFQFMKMFQILSYKSVTMLMSSYVPQLEAKNRVLLCHESDILTSGNSVHKRELVCNPFCVVDILVTELPKCLTLVCLEIAHNSEHY